MYLLETIELDIKVAERADAQNMITFSQKVGQETGFLSYGEEGIATTLALQEQFIEYVNACDNQIILLGYVGNELAGMITVKAEEKPKMKHIGELGIMVSKKYWGFGIGTALIDEVFHWIETTGVIKRLELTVQERNHRAVRLYEHLGFTKEALMPYGVYDAGEYLSVWLMSKLFHE